MRPVEMRSPFRIDDEIENERQRQNESESDHFESERKSKLDFLWRVAFENSETKIEENEFVTRRATDVISISRRCDFDRQQKTQ